MYAELLRYNWLGLLSGFSQALVHAKVLFDFSYKFSHIQHTGTKLHFIKHYFPNTY